MMRNMECFGFLLLHGLLFHGVSPYPVPNPPIGASDSFTKCYPTYADFNQLCTQQFFGVTDGNQCFFVEAFTDGAGWNGAWQACKGHGATLAQIYTKSEYDKIFAYVRGIFGTGVVSIALKDDSAMPPCVLQSSTVYFWDDVATANTLVPIFNNTWLGRTHYCDDYASEGLPRCIYMYLEPPHIFDDTCTSSISGVAVCQGSNHALNYTLSSGCMAERAVLQNVTVATPQECAEMCASERWCRSFSFLSITGDINDVNNKCELFSWSATDTSQMIGGRAECYHYNYVA